MKIKRKLARSGASLQARIDTREQEMTLIVMHIKSLNKDSSNKRLSLMKDMYWIHSMKIITLKTMLQMKKEIRIRLLLNRCLKQTKVM